MIKKKSKFIKKVLITVFLFTAFVLCNVMSVSAADFSFNGSQSETINIIEMLTVLMLLPSILIMTTCFTRIIIVLSFLRNALGLQQTPPNQVLIGISLFLSLFIMNPVLSQIDQNAYEPYKQGQITQQEFVQKASEPLKEFMLKQTKKDDLNLFVDLSKGDINKEAKDQPITTIIPAFMTSELRRAFLIGFLLFIPFLIIDMVVSSALMSMGMIMLPPTTISLPFKLLLFVLVGGWDLLFKSLVAGFNM